MQIQEFKELYEYERTYWWHVGRLKIINKQLERLNKTGLVENARILNVGAGTGGTIATLEKFGKVTNVDTSRTAIEYLQSSGYAGKLVKGMPLPYKDNEFDMVVALDVLEHIKDDEGALMEWFRVLKPSGFMFLTVPAYQWLWSDHDEAMHHFRRYNRNNLKSKLTRQDPIVVKLGYMFAFSLPMIASYRLFVKIRKHGKSEGKSSFVRLPKLLNTLFIQLLYVEAVCQRFINFPFGTSVLAVMKKKPSIW